MRRYRVVFQIAVVAAISLSVISCGKGNLRPNEELAGVEPGGGEYYVNGGDVLNIKVWGEQRLTGDVVVREDGKFTMPLIDDVDSQGKTLMQLNDELKKRLEEFIPGVSVTASVVQASAVRFFVIGELQKPGEYRSDKRINLIQAIVKAGGFAPFADKTIVLIRQGSEGEMRYELDYEDVVVGKEPNPILKDGDVVSVK